MVVVGEVCAAMSAENTFLACASGFNARAYNHLRTFLADPQAGAPSGLSGFDVSGFNTEMAKDIV